MPRRVCPGIVRVPAFLVVAVVGVLSAARGDAAPPRGTIEVETTDATSHDRVLFEGIARELERQEGLWSSPPTRGSRTFRLKTYARGGVRSIADQGNSCQTKEALIACKLLSTRLWRLKLRSTAPRAVVVTFRFRPKAP